MKERKTKVRHNIYSSFGEKDKTMDPVLIEIQDELATLKGIGLVVAALRDGATDNIRATINYAQESIEDNPRLMAEILPTELFNKIKNYKHGRFRKIEE